MMIRGVTLSYLEEEVVNFKSSFILELLLLQYFYNGKVYVENKIDSVVIIWWLESTPRWLDIFHLVENLGLECFLVIRNNMVVSNK